MPIKYEINNTYIRLFADIHSYKFLVNEIYPKLHIIHKD